MAAITTCINRRSELCSENATTNPFQPPVGKGFFVLEAIFPQGWESIDETQGMARQKATIACWNKKPISSTEKGAQEGSFREFLVVEVRSDVY